MIQKRAKNTISIQINDWVTYAALFIAFYCGVNGELRYTESTFIYYLPGLACFAALVVELMSKRLVFSPYLMWRMILTVFFAFTMLYALDWDEAFGIMKQWAIQSVVVALIAVRCANDPKNIRSIMMIGLLACVVTMFYIYGAVDMEMVERGERLGIYSVNEAWNANNIGLMSAFGILLTFCLTFVQSKKVTKRSLLICIALMASFGYMMIISGSRKSILVILVALLVYILLGQKTKKARNLLIAAVAMLVAVYALYNVPFLYNSVGIRFESALGMISGTSEGDGSSQLRLEMIEAGMDWFWNKPILGYGMDAFSVMFKESHNRLTYSHNNYVELLVTGGAVCFALYYVFIGRVLLQKRATSKHSGFAKGLLIGILIADVGCVSYYDPLIQYIICLSIYSLQYTDQLDEVYGKLSDSRQWDIRRRTRRRI